MAEKIFVIDGHKLDVEPSELLLVNDVREIYDTNMQKTMDSFVNDSIWDKELPTESFIEIHPQNALNNIYIMNENIYRFTSSEKNLEINIFNKNNTIFKLETDSDFKVSEYEFGHKIDCPKKSYLQFFSNEKTTVISDNLTNKILKYSSTEIKYSHKYTQYYEYLDEQNLIINLVLVDFIPITLTVYKNNTKEVRETFKFKY